MESPTIPVTTGSRSTVRRPATKLSPASRSANPECRNTVGRACLLSPGSSDIISDKTSSPNRQSTNLPSSPSQLEPPEIQNIQRTNIAVKTARRIDTPRNRERGETNRVEVDEIQITDTRQPNQQLGHAPLNENPAIIFTEQQPVNLSDVQSVRRDPETEMVDNLDSSDVTVPTGQQLSIDTPQQLTQASSNQRDVVQKFDTLEQNIRSRMGCMETTIEQQRQEIARQGQLFESYQRGVGHKAQEVMEGLFQTIASHFNKQIEDWSEYANSTNQRYEEELKQLRDRLEKTNEELHAQLESQRNDYRLLEQSTNETERQLLSFQNPLKIKPDTIKPTTEHLGTGSYGGIYIYIYIYIYI